MSCGDGADGRRRNASGATGTGGADGGGATLGDGADERSDGALTVPGADGGGVKLGFGAYFAAGGALGAVGNEGPFRRCGAYSRITGGAGGGAKLGDALKPLRPRYCPNDCLGILLVDFALERLLERELLERRPR